MQSRQQVPAPRSQVEDRTLTSLLCKIIQKSVWSHPARHDSRKNFDDGSEFTIDNSRYYPFMHPTVNIVVRADISAHLLLVTPAKQQHPVLAGVQTQWVPFWTLWWDQRPCHGLSSWGSARPRALPATTTTALWIVSFHFHGLFFQSRVSQWIIQICYSISL